MNVSVSDFGKTKKGEIVKSYLIKTNILEVEILSYGGIIRKLLTPDKYGNWENIVLGFNTMEKYEKNSAYFGCIVGRNAGRIGGASFEIENQKYNLAQNSGKNNIHGGINGLHNRVWESTYEVSDETTIITLKTFSPDLEEGFPGNIHFTVKYIIKDGDITIDYEGITDKTTYLNLTNHTYFNLSGNLKKNILKQEIYLNANGYLEVNDETLPIQIGKDEAFYSPAESVLFEGALTSNHEQVKIVNGGYDHPFILSKDREIDGWIFDKDSGRKLEFITDQPIVVIYTGNYLDTVDTIYDNFKGSKHLGFCLETQDIPDIFNYSPENIKLYTPEIPYRQKTTFKFSASK